MNLKEFERFARIVATLLLVTTLAACSYSRPKPFPIHKAEMPACPNGVWVCDARAGKVCVCLSEPEYKRWKRKNGF